MFGRILRDTVLFCPPQYEGLIDIFQNAIEVFQRYMIKYAYFIPCREKITVWDIIEKHTNVILFFSQLINGRNNHIKLS
jgi:hypothetical protein